MKYIQMVVLLILTFSIFAISEEDCLIPADRLPWTDATHSKLEWEDAGCQKHIESLEIEKYIDVTNDLVNYSDLVGLSFTEKIQFIVDIENSFEDGKTLLLYFPSGTYTFQSDIEVTRSNIIFLGDGANQTNFHCDKIWYSNYGDGEREI